MFLPNITIIIPVYNVEPYISDCLHSVMRQTYQGPLECILVDDCGTDKSIEVAEQLIAEYDGPIEFKVLHHEYNRGLSAARNTGVNFAEGDYLYFLDSDDYISDDCLKILTQPLEKMDYDMVIGNLETFGLHCDICFLPQKTGNVLGNESVFSKFYVERMIYVMAWNKLTKVSLFRDNDLSFLEGQLHEDELWTYKFSLCAKSIFVQHRVTYYYRRREGSIINNNTQIKSKERLDSCYKTIDYVLSHPAKVSKDSYNKAVVYFFGIYLRNIGVDKIDFQSQYVGLRKRFDYRPLKLFLKGNLSLSELKHRFHLALPPMWGCLYLELRRKINRNR